MLSIPSLVSRGSLCQGHPATQARLTAGRRPLPLPREAVARRARLVVSSQLSSAAPSAEDGWESWQPTGAAAFVVGDAKTEAHVPMHEEAPVMNGSRDGTTSFSWTKQWYGVAAAHDLDPSRPNAITLLGKQVVIWKDGIGTWSCLEDRCPHRAAPLSEGMVWRDGNICCSYHGWRFSGSGSCKAIPQAASADAEAKAAASRRACAVSYPVQERQGMVFVWAEGGPGAHEESAKHLPPICSFREAMELEGRSVVDVQAHYTRDLPYDYAGAVENLVDPAHIPWAHHGVVGNRDAVEYGKTQLHRSGKLEVSYDSNGMLFSDTGIKYHPPGLITYTLKAKMGGTVTQVLWLVPTVPGRCRVTVNLAAGEPLPWLLKIMGMTPAWLQHINAAGALFDGDNVFLAGQDRFLAQSAHEGKTWRNLFYMPTAADSLVSAFRNWMDTEGGGGPFGSLRDAGSQASAAAVAALVAPSPRDDRHAMLDRYNQHTIHCQPCRGALKNITLSRNVMAGLAAVGWAASFMPFLCHGQEQGWSGSSLADAASVAMIPAGFAAAFSCAGVVLQNLRHKFFFVDYVHADK